VIGAVYFGRILGRLNRRHITNHTHTSVAVLFCSCF
jgi:hypothetical protein